MTQEEINKLPFYLNCKYALVNTETKEIIIDSTDEQDCIDAKNRMGKGHPLWSKIEVVQKTN